MLFRSQISKEINIDASQIAKDLSYVNISGRTRVGYEVDALIAVLEDFLGFTNMHKAFLFGVGSLGGALLLVFGIATFEVSRIVSGLSYAHVGSAADIALWFGLSVLIVSMYGAAIAVVTWLTQSKAAGLAAAIAVGSTLLGGLVVTVLQGLAMLWEHEKKVC